MNPRGPRSRGPRKTENIHFVKKSMQEWLIPADASETPGHASTAQENIKPVDNPATPSHSLVGQVKGEPGRGHKALPHQQLSTAAESPKTDGGEESLQMLPAELLKSKLEECTALPSMETALIAVRHKTSTPSPSISSHSDNDTFRPVPLHVIRAMTSKGEGKTPNAAFGVPTWEISELDASESSNAKSESLPKQEEKAQHSSFLRSEDEPVFVSEMMWDSFTGDWLRAVEEAPMVALHHDGVVGQSDHYHDFDTDTGQKIPMVEQPETFQGPDHEDHEDYEDYESGDSYQDFAWRRASMTSDLHIAKELKVRQSLAERLRMDVAERKREQKPVHELPPRRSASCLVRPAVLTDLPKVVEVINSEGKEKIPRLPVYYPVQLNDLREVFNTCAREFCPFIVAVDAPEDFLDRSKWPEEADKEFEEFVKFKEAQLASRDEKVLGFAYITTLRPSLSGDTLLSTKFSGRITLLVHPDHRRKLYGTALLERIMRCVRPGWGRPPIDFRWKCDDAGVIYQDSAEENRRPFARMYTETISASQYDDRHMEWMTKFLKQFPFKQVGKLGSAFYKEEKNGEKWHDLIVWELEIYSSMGGFEKRIRDSEFH